MDGDRHACRGFKQELRRSFSSNDPSFVVFKGNRLGYSVAVFSGEEQLRSAVAWVLHLIGCRQVSEHAQVVDSAVESMLADPVDLILCDMDLAECLISKLAHSPQSPHVVLMVPKRFDRQWVSARLDQGASGYVTKPLRIQSIRGVVVKYLKGNSSGGPFGQDEENQTAQQYETLHLIGRGRFGEVTLVRRNRDGTTFALKELQVGHVGIQEQRRTINELRLHRSFSCPCIVRCFSSWLQGDTARLLMEYVEAGSLSNQVVKSKREGAEIPDARILDWCGQMLIGLMYLHQKSVLHRDLKLDNVLGPTLMDCVKLSDFGVALELGSDSHSPHADAKDLSFAGTPEIMAPERCAAGMEARRVKYGLASDVWSLGVVLYELAALEPPFQTNEVHLFDNIGKRAPPPLPFSRSADMHKLIVGGLLQKEPEHRPNIEDLVREPMIGAAIYKFLNRCNLLTDPSVLEIIDVLPNSDHSSQSCSGRIEVSQADVVSCFLQGSSKEINPELSLANVLEHKTDESRDFFPSERSNCSKDQSLASSNFHRFGNFASDKSMKQKKRQKPYLHQLRSKSTNSLTSGMTCLTGITEHEFQALDKADDAVARTTSLETIKSRGMVENWLLDPMVVKMQQDVLGAGAFGVVHTGQLYGTPIALKTPKAEMVEHKQVSYLANELRVLRHVRHPAIVAFCGACVDPSSGGIVLALERVDGQKLGHFVRRNSNYSDESARYMMLLDICAALSYLHAQKPCIVHGDLKDSNILVELWRSGPRPKLLDFGLSRLLTKHTTPLGGTISWMAPEVIRNPSGSPASSADVFSFGRLAYFMITRKKPLEFLGCDEILRSTQANSVPPLDWSCLEETALVSECRSLVRDCLQIKPLLRPTMDDVESTIKSWTIPDHTDLKLMQTVERKIGKPKGELLDWELGVAQLRATALAVCMSEGSTSSSLNGFRSGVRSSTLSKIRLSVRGSKTTATDGDKDSIDSIVHSSLVRSRLIDASRIRIMPDAVVSVGGFGAVVPATLDGFLTAVHVPRDALKATSSMRLNASDDVLQVLFQVKHPNIAVLHGIILEPTSGFVAPILEWVEGDILQDFVQKQPMVQESVASRTQLLLDIFSSLWYLHGQTPALVHGSLNGSSIIVEARESGPRAKLLDWGLKRFLRCSLPSDAVLSVKNKDCPEWLRLGRKQALVWLSPEVLQQKAGALAPSADIYAAGRLIYLVVAGQQPLGEYSLIDLENAAKKGPLPALKWPSDALFASRASLMTDRCCNSNAVVRPPATVVFNEIKSWPVATEPLQQCCLIPMSEESNPIGNVNTEAVSLDLNEKSTASGCVVNKSSEDYVETLNTVSESSQHGQGTTAASPRCVHGMRARQSQAPPCPSVRDENNDGWVGDDYWIVSPTIPLRIPPTSTFQHSCAAVAVDQNMFRCPDNDEPCLASVPVRLPTPLHPPLH